MCMCVCKHAYAECMCVLTSVCIHLNECMCTHASAVHMHLHACLCTEAEHIAGSINWKWHFFVCMVTPFCVCVVTVGGTVLRMVINLVFIFSSCKYAIQQTLPLGTMFKIKHILTSWWIALLPECLCSHTRMHACTHARTHARARYCNINTHFYDHSQRLVFHKCACSTCLMLSY